MEFPKEIMQMILEYLPHPYRKPLHLEAIASDARFADFVIEQAFNHEDGDTPDWGDSFIAYRKWRRGLG